eukprot:6184758-Pleurochrysis_carterae.AAC.2
MHARNTRTSTHARSRARAHARERGHRRADLCASARVRAQVNTCTRSHQQASARAGVRARAFQWRAPNCLLEIRELSTCALPLFSGNAGASVDRFARVWRLRGEDEQPFERPVAAAAAKLRRRAGLVRAGQALLA